MANLTASATAESTASQTEAVDAYMKKLKHPMKDAAELLRVVILDAHKQVGEEIAWNAPAFYYTGKMNPFPPKEYKRFICGMNFFKKDCLRLIFLRGAVAKDPEGLLKGDFKDGRRLVMFASAAEVKAKQEALQKIVKQLAGMMK